MGQSSSVQILLAVRNGGQYLAEQLDSIAAQQYRNWSLLVADDGSTDGAVDIVQNFARRVGDDRVRLVPGPQHGLATNFLTLLWQAQPDRAIAFCDQDDVWMPHKLARAMAHIQASDGEIMAYCCRTIQTDANLRPQRLSPWPVRGPSFGNALVQNILAGNTMVLSASACALLRETVPAAITANVPFHDWWAYQIIAGVGGRIVLDPKPGLYYRQHGHNAQGAASGILANLTRARMLLTQVYANWISRNTAAMQAHKTLLTASARATLGEFIAARAGPHRALAARMASQGIRRQTTKQDRVLGILARMGRL